MNSIMPPIPAAWVCHTFLMDEGLPSKIAAEFVEDTIVAISTPAGRGGIGIVRLSANARRRLLRDLCE